MQRHHDIISGLSVSPVSNVLMCQCVLVRSFFGGNLRGIFHNASGHLKSTHFRSEPKVSTGASQSGLKVLKMQIEGYTEIPEELGDELFHHGPVNSWFAVSPSASQHTEFDSTSAWRIPGPRSAQHQWTLQRPGLRGCYPGATAWPSDNMAHSIRQHTGLSQQSSRMRAVFHSAHHTSLFC